MSLYHLAQFNIARMRAPLDHPIMAEFKSKLPEINALADRSPGFVWRLQGEYGDATDIAGYDDPLILVNISVWISIEAIKTFTYAGDHAASMRNRRNWFEKITEPQLVLWWTPEHHRPTVTEGKAKLAQLRQAGETASAFTFRVPYNPPVFPVRAVG